MCANVFGASKALTLETREQRERLRRTYHSGLVFVWLAFDAGYKVGAAKALISPS
jgi:hypothetical protein